MKKILAMILCAIAFVACEKDETPDIDYSNLIVGTWVYDHPEEGVWETMKFTSSGVFYYSNSSDLLYEFSNENVNGRYFIDGNNITGTYLLNEATQMNLDMTITKISGYAFTVRTNDTGLSFTYARQIDKLSLKYGESIAPNYMELIRDANIIGYSSHNPNIVTVNPSTGEITGVMKGVTYIDVVTSEGTAVIAVQVNGLLEHNYDEYIGATHDKIYEIFGDAPAADTGDVIVYQYDSNSEIQYMRIGFNPWTNLVSSIRLYVSNVNSAYISEMTDYLSSMYTVYEKGTTSDYKAYINNVNYDDATTGITWDINNLQITYVALNHDLFTDFSPAIGRTQAEVKALMSKYTPFISNDQQMAYGISDGKVDLVSFFFTLDFVQTYNTVQAVITQLNGNLTNNQVHEYLSKKYVYMADDSTPVEKVYITEDALKAIYYDVENQQVLYFPTKPGTKGLNKAGFVRELNEAAEMILSR